MYSPASSLVECNINPKRILVTKLRLIGDVVLSTPVYQALKQQFPSAEIYACVNSGTESVLRNNPFLAGTLVRKPSRRGFSISDWAREWAFVREVRRKTFDIAIDLTASDRSAILTWISGAPIRLGFDLPGGFLGRKRLYSHSLAPPLDQHMVRRQLDLLRPIGVLAKDLPLTWTVSKADEQKVSELVPASRPFVQVHPLSSKPKKNWPIEFFADISNRIGKTGLLVVITGTDSPEERRWLENLRRRLEVDYLDLGGQLTLNEIGALSRRATCFFGVDTAPMHIAAAVGTPVIALYGPTSENVWRPWCEKSLILSRPLPCRPPCKNRSCETIHCLRELTPDMVWPSVSTFIREIDRRSHPDKQPQSARATP